MNIYIDESGSINNHDAERVPYFVVAMIHVTNKENLKRIYRRFISANLERLRELDCDRVDQKTGKTVRPGGKMFVNGKFHELKGNQFDREMKKKFVDYFSKGPYFEIYYIRIKNGQLSDKFCLNTARVFNYNICLSLGYFFNKGFLPDEPCNLQLDERNEKTETKYFLANYLNTHLTMSGTVSGPFTVQYFDSSCNQFIQIADVFANLYFSQLQTSCYSDEMKKLENAGMLKFIFDFPLSEY